MHKGRSDVVELVAPAVTTEDRVVAEALADDIHRYAHVLACVGRLVFALKPLVVESEDNIFALNAGLCKHQGEKNVDGVGRKTDRAVVKVAEVVSLNFRDAYAGTGDDESRVLTLDESGHSYSPPILP